MNTNNNFSLEESDTYFIARDKEGNYLIDSLWYDESGPFQLEFDGAEYLEYKIYMEKEIEILRASIRDAYELIGPIPDYDILQVDKKTIYTFKTV